MERTPEPLISRKEFLPVIGVQVCLNSPNKKGFECGEFLGQFGIAGMGAWRSGGGLCATSMIVGGGRDA
jgi:hypothetical protein